METKASYRLALKKKIQVLKQWRRETTQVPVCWTEIAAAYKNAEDDADEMARMPLMRELGKVFTHVARLVGIEANKLQPFSMAKSRGDKDALAAERTKALSLAKFAKCSAGFASSLPTSAQLFNNWEEKLSWWVKAGSRVRCP